MKSYLISIFLVFNMMANAHIEPPKTLKEKLKMEVEYAKKASAGMRECFIKNKLPDGKEVAVVHYFYDCQGREERMYLFDAEGKIEAHVIQVYDASGNLVLDADRSPEGLLKEMNVLGYDDDGLIWTITSYDSAWMISGKLTYEVRPETSEVFVSKINKDNGQEYSISYQYDGSIEDGDCIEIIQNDAQGSLKIRVENEFDTNGLRTKKHIYGPDNELSYSFFSTYNPNGDFATITQVDAEEKVIRTDTYTYNDKGFVSYLRVVKADGTISAERVYEYVFE
ncbi:MAG: hypothetical protein FD155_1889 [Bacteroidetes bacterium]|nr:MAG: hypothetical protein FD155_1889 [Bacteroidota bacterium]